jgi:hypothetical protein
MAGNGGLKHSGSMVIVFIRRRFLLQPPFNCGWAVDIQVLRYRFMEISAHVRGLCWQLLTSGASMIADDEITEHHGRIKVLKSPPYNLADSIQCVAEQLPRLEDGRIMFVSVHVIWARYLFAEVPVESSTHLIVVEREA